MAKPKQEAALADGVGSFQRRASWTSLLAGGITGAATDTASTQSSDYYSASRNLPLVKGRRHNVVVETLMVRKEIKETYSVMSILR